MSRIHRSSPGHATPAAKKTVAPGPSTAKTAAGPTAKLQRARGFDAPDRVEAPRTERAAPLRGFGRMFPDLAPLVVSAEAVTALANAMVDPGDTDNETIPAGYTYLGQFIDHDITFDPTPSSRLTADPSQLRNFRTPAFDLDNLYGNGATVDPHLYQRKDPRLLAIGMTRASRDLKDRPPIPPSPNDLPRSAEKVALVGDPRDDENLIVAQTHVAFAHFHNAIVTSKNVSFDDARRIVTWHYQWIVLHDFAERLCGKDVIADVLTNGRKFYQPGATPYMPVEFASAAYRLGHSMVRETYDYNRLFGPKSDDGSLPRLTPATLPILFAFTGASSNGNAMPLQSHWAIDWRRWYDLGEPVPNSGIFNFSRKIDPYLAPALHNLPPSHLSLAQLNLTRGVRMGLPSGQDVARAMGITPLTPEEIGSGPVGKVAAEQGLAEATPLWFYILQEASVRSDGHKLGPVGARICAEVFVGLLQKDPESFLAQNPKWKPDLGATPGLFTMADLIKLAGNVNPIGD